MEKRFSGLVCLLFLIIAVEFVMYSEAVAECRSRSREYKARRCTRRNCNIICKHERFVYGLCQKTKILGTKCYCYKPCNAGGGGGGRVNPPPSNEDSGDTPPTGGGDDPPPSGGSNDPPPSGGSDDPPPSGGNDDSPPSGDTPTTDPRQCKARSREYKGRRCTRRNCNIICKHERFESGKCLRSVGIKTKCYCYKPCSDALAGYTQ